MYYLHFIFSFDVYIKGASVAAPSCSRYKHCVICVASMKILFDISLLDSAFRLKFKKIYILNYFYLFNRSNNRLEYVLKILFIWQ